MGDALKIQLPFSEPSCFECNLSQGTSAAFTIMVLRRFLLMQLLLTSMTLNVSLQVKY